MFATTLPKRLQLYYIKRQFLQPELLKPKYVLYLEHYSSGSCNFNSYLVPPAAHTLRFVPALLSNLLII